MVLYDLNALEKDVLQARMFSPCQSLAYLEIRLCLVVRVYVCVCVCVCVCEREIETVLRGFV